MAPEQGHSLSPGFDAGTTEFELTAQLYHAIFFHDGKIPTDVVRALCCNALESPDGCFVVGEVLSGNAAWTELHAQAKTSGTLAAATPSQGASLPARLGFPLLFRERMLGFVGVAGRPGGYDAPTMRRFADLGA